MSTTHEGPESGSAPFYPEDGGHERIPTPSEQPDERAGGIPPSLEPYPPQMDMSPSLSLQRPQLDPRQEQQPDESQAESAGGKRKLSRRNILIGGALAGVAATLVAIDDINRRSKEAERRAPRPGSSPDINSPDQNTASPEYPNIPGTKWEVHPVGTVNSTKVYPGEAYHARWNSDITFDIPYLYLPGGKMSVQESMNRCLRAFAIMLTLPDDEFETMLPHFVKTDIAKDGIRFVRSRTPINLNPADTNNLFVIFDIRDNPSKVENWQTKIPGQADLVETRSRNMPLNVTLDEGLKYQAPIRMRLLSSAYVKEHEGEDLAALSSIWQESHGLANLWFWLVPSEDGRALIEGFNVEIRSKDGNSNIVRISSLS